MIQDEKKFINDGNPDFQSLITNNCLYVDKTRYIKVLESMGSYNIVLRPKRFGKSLFTSMLMYYYDVRYKDDFDSLFSGLYIHENKTRDAGSYNVLKFDFSGIQSGRDNVEPQFKDTVRINFEFFAWKCGLDIAINKEASLSSLTRDFLSNYQRLSRTKIYLLIDEYDNFANAVLGDDFDYFRDITGKSGFVRSFYEVFKEFSGTLIERVYITGVTPITLDALASGFNFVINRSLDPRINNMIGFSQAELDWMIEYYGVDPVHKEVMKEHYNGYMFDNDSNDSERVYNSTLVFYYLAKVVGTNRPPVNYLDARISSSPGMVRQLIDLYQDTQTKLEMLKAIEEEGSITGQVLLKFDGNAFMQSRHDVLSMLFYLGFLTIRENYGGQSLLTIPNRTVEELYTKLYLGYMNDLLEPGTSELNGCVINMLRNGDTKPFVDFLHKNLSLLDDHDFDHMNEQGIKNFIVAYLRLYQNIRLETELSVEEGRIDIAILPALLHRFKHYYLIEIKYISASGNTKAERNKKRKEALAQLVKYKKSQRVIEAEEFATVHKLYMQVIKNNVTVEEIT